MTTGMLLSTCLDSDLSRFGFAFDVFDTGALRTVAEKPESFSCMVSSSTVCMCMYVCMYVCEVT